MRTPFGQECKFFYADYFRGRKTEACRLLERNPNTEPWFVGLCRTCPVPGILAANQCPNLKLRGRVARGFLGITKKFRWTRYARNTALKRRNRKSAADIAMNSNE